MKKFLSHSNNNTRRSFHMFSSKQREPVPNNTSKCSFFLFLAMINGLLFVAPHSGYAEDLTKEDINPLIRACRDVFPPATIRADATGGWSFVKVGEQKMALCIVGSLGKTQISELTNASKGVPVSHIIVRSSGGSSQVWLELSEAFEPNGIKLVVDDICLSSCAIYLTVIAAEIAVLPGSIIAWHGGASWKTMDKLLTAAGDIETILKFSRMVERTESLYRRNDISIDILYDSLLKTHAGILKTVLKNLGETINPQVTILGYAYSPANLSACFGFSTRLQFWHPGEDLDVARTVNIRNKKLIALESPKDKNGKLRCAGLN